MSERVRYFDKPSAPKNPFSGQQFAGWYWLDSEGEWDGPAPNGEAEARRHAEFVASGQGSVR